MRIKNLPQRYFKRSKISLEVVGSVYGGGNQNPSFDPASLFGASEVGMFYDPQTIETLFQDTAGTFPVTADGQLVARINDRSGNGYHLIQANAANQYVYKDVAGVRWLDSGGRQCIYDSGRKLTGGLTIGISVRPETFATTRTWFDTGSGSATAVNSIYMDRSGSSKFVRFHERAASVLTQRSTSTLYEDKHLAYVARLQAVSGDTNHLIFGDAALSDSTGRLFGNTTSGTGLRLGPTDGAAPLRWYGAIFIQRVISDVERDALIGWLSEIGETETPYLWMGDAT